MIAICKRTELLDPCFKTGSTIIVFITSNRTTMLNLNFAISMNVLRRTKNFPHGTFSLLKLTRIPISPKCTGALHFTPKKRDFNHFHCNATEPILYVEYPKFFSYTCIIMDHTDLLRYPYSLAATRESVFFPSVPLVICLSSRILSLIMTPQQYALQFSIIDRMFFKNLSSFMIKGCHY